MEYGLIGERLPHSFSKEIHEKCADYRYELTELTPSQIPEFMARREFKAINVTIPYKQTVIPFLTQMDEGAKSIGAVNTVVNKNGELHGYNTDFYGMEALLEHVGIFLTDKKVLILGSGGTSKTATAVANAAAAKEILVVGRPQSNPQVTYEEVYKKHTDAQIIINTTPCGMYPYADGTAERSATPIDLSYFPNLEGVVDAVYNPLRTNLILDAKKREIPSEGGLYMLVAQGVKASRIFLDADFDGMKRQTDAIYKEILRNKENVVLTGMPASGKTTVGKLLAELLHRPFVDLDEVIVEFAGKDIPQIFGEVGEGGFRDLEAQAVRKIANETAGAVIATGGGAILRDENVCALRRTGKIYFLDRPLEALLPTQDRPLASTAYAIRARYNERYHRYRDTCDIRVVSDGSVEQTAEFIRKDFLA